VGRKRRNPISWFLHEHSLSLLLGALVLSLVFLYVRSDPRTHLGTFYGNAIADWVGVLTFVLATKYFVEQGSGESRSPRPGVHARLARVLQVHSLTIVMALTALLWLFVYSKSDVDSKAGQVVGNIVSAWIQILGLIVITKYARERGSKEGR